MWTRLGALLVLAGTIGAITRDQLYTYGPEVDSELLKGPDVSSPEQPLRVPVRFYGETYDSIYVNNGGLVSFRFHIPRFINAEFPLPYPSIAAFYTNVDTTESGAIYFRESDETHVLAKAQESVQSNFLDYQDFQPTSVFIATWIEVTYSNAVSVPKNSFQIAIISNGTESFVELLYPEGELQWIHKEALAHEPPEAKAQAGFVAEDGRMYILKGSGSHQVRNIMSWSNVRQPGKYLFRVGQIPTDGNIALPENYNPSDYEEEEVTCAATSGSSICDVDAVCVDYETGICCQCNEGYYGNGKSCIKKDVPIRLHGKLNGMINTVSLNDVDIQAYVVVDEGRSYTALSQGPSSIGGSLQLLNVLGDVVGWLFAKPVGHGKNGYQLTGSTFNHTANVFFPETRHRVTVTQQYLGHDVFDQISLESDVRGTLPIVESDDKITLSEYEEQFSQIESGVIRSESTFIFVNKRTGQTYHQKVSQTFTYSSCKFATSEDLETPLTLKSTKNYLNYELINNVVRYSMMTKLTPFSNEDPCIKGRNECGPLSTCVIQGSSYRCVCKPGYTNINLLEPSPCEDIDECSAGTHNCDSNADCYNYEGGFRCRCREGFEGNGVWCSPASRCQNERCDDNAQCINTSDSFGEQSNCVCNPGYTGDGRRCWELDSSSCELLRNCNPNADCVQSLLNLYECRCREGYVGNGYYCAKENGQEEPPTTPPPFTINEYEYNGTYFLPNCDSNNQCTCPSGYLNFIDDIGNNICRLAESEPLPQSTYGSSTAFCDTDRDCAPNAVCTFKTCMCPEGYEGDGFECIERIEHACNCSPKASCLMSSLKPPMCVCDQGYHFEGDECRPNFICTNNSDCEYNAECVLDSATNEYVCQCVEGFKKDPNDACIPDRALCNGAVCAEHASCLYDETIGLDYCYCDEGYEGVAIVKCVPHHETCEVRNNCHPDAVCTYVGSSFECICKEGFIGDGFNCVLEPSCRNNSYLCDVHASCLKRNEGYVCECNSGYFGNGSSCTMNPRQTGNFLVASDGVCIYKVPFQVSVRQNAIPINSGNDQIAVGLDVDCQTGKVYWGDVSTNSIKRAAYDGSEPEVFLGNEVKSPEGIAIDWAARNIFWTDPKRLSIEVANMDTRLRKILFQYDGIANPRGIAVHPQRGKIFWSDWKRGSPKIEWANMDGSERGVFLSTADVKLPNSLTIDWDGDRLCYTDAGRRSIECVGIDDKKRETIASNCLYPFDLAVNEGIFYWTDWKTLKIEYIDSRTNTRGQLPIQTASRKHFGIATAPEQCANLSNVCQYRNGNCSIDEICLPNGLGSRTCAPGF